MSLVIKTQEPDYVSIDAIKSHLVPDRKKLLEMLDFFEKGEYGNTNVSDVAMDELRSMGKFYKKELGLSYNTHVRVIYYDDHNFDLKEFRETLDWMVLELLIWTSTDPIFVDEVPMIRGFLETPTGREKKAVEKWLEYWEKVNFESRKGVAPL